MIDVACAVILDDAGRVLVTQRSAMMSLPHKWEFPGGKLEAGETARKCLAREIREELDLEIEVLDPLQMNIHTYGTVTIRLLPFSCRILSGTIQLREHRAFLWQRPDELLQLDLAEADIPIARNLLTDH